MARNAVTDGRSHKSKRLGAEKQAGLDKSRQVSAVVHPRKQKLSKRERKRKQKDLEEFPGLHSIANEKSDCLTAGEDILAFTFAGEKEVEEISEEISEEEGEKISEKEGEKESEKEGEDVKKEKKEEDFISLDIETDSELGQQFSAYETDLPPWLDTSTDSATVASQLSQEMLDFLCYVSPNEREQKTRSSCVSRLRRVVRHLWPDASLEVFGSYATGMYLPDADIDVVIFDHEMGRKLRNDMYKLANWLKKQGVSDSVQVISHARVPIIKYIDRQSRLNVDLSFGQTSGVEVVGRVCEWLRATPTMKALAMVIRQFLKRRVLSDVASGGLGGYATTCLVYSRLMQWKLHKNPLLNNDNLLENIGLLLIDFFDYYGNQFDNQNQVVRVNSSFLPYEKRMNGSMLNNKPNTLSIEDPNDYGNNISKGTFNYPVVKRCFGNAASYLKALSLQWANSPIEKRRHMSFLAPLLKFSDAPHRTKIDIETALSTPNAPDYTQKTEAKMDSQIHQRRMDLDAQIRQHMTARPPQRKRRAKNEPKIDPWMSDGAPKNSNAEEPKVEPKKPRIDESEDSRTRLTSDERRSFWKKKGGIDAV